MSAPVVCFSSAYVLLLLLAPVLLPMPPHPEITSLAIYILLFAVGILAFREPLANDAKLLFSRWWFPLREAPLALGLLVLLIIAGSLLIEVLVALTGIEPALGNDAAVFSSVTSLPPLLILGVFGVAGPAVEELFFRGFLLGGVSRRVPAWTAILISGIAFGLIHVHSLTLAEFIAVIPHTATGIALAVTAWRTGIILPIAIHVMINLSSLLPAVISA